MSLSKKYVYVHKCSLAQNTPDNFRKVLGRAWVPSQHSGLQYGYDVKPPVMDMTFGPYMEWEQDYFYASAMPATTQIVSIKPNPYYFPDVESTAPTVNTDAWTEDYPAPESLNLDEPCCGWYAYLGAFFTNHFSDGNPVQILNGILISRVEDYKSSVAKGTSSHLDVRYFPRNSCGDTVGYLVQDTQDLNPTVVDDVQDDGSSSTQATPRYDSMKIRLFKDLWFQIMTPFSDSEDAHFEGREKALASDVKFNYNFFLSAYEEQLRDASLSEIRIPNLYLTVGQDGSIPYVTYLTNNVKCRFQDFTKLILQKGYREYMFPVKQQPSLQDKNIYSTSFPMDTKISFGTDRSTFVADALEDSKMECGMLRRAAEGAILLEDSTIESSTTAFEGSRQIPYTRSSRESFTPPNDQPAQDFVYAKRYYDTMRTGQHSTYGPQPRSLRTFDFYQWLLSLPDLPPSVVPLPSDHIFLGNENDSTDMAQKVGLYQQNLSFLANYFILSGKINEIAKTHIRTYQQMMRGDTPHSETVLYRISKYSTEALRQAGIESSDAHVREHHRLDPEDRDTHIVRGPAYEQLETNFDLIYSNKIEPIQNIWIPNSNSIDVVEYVDTQIKYNKGYTYTVTAYELSVATEYFYSQYYGKNPERPQPEPQICAEPGPIAVAGPYAVASTKLEDDADPIVRTLGLILADTSLTEGQKYEQINSFLAENSQWAPDTGTPGDTSQATGMVFLIKPGVQSQMFSLAILSYCFDHQIAPDSGWTKLAGVQNTSTRATGDTKEKSSKYGQEEGACTIFSLQTMYLQLQGGLVDSSDSLIAALQQLGITSPPKAEYSSANMNHYKGIKCPDGWTEGKVRSFTAQVEGEIPIGETPFELLYLGEAEFKAVCECPPPEPCRETFLATTFPSLKVHEVPYMMWSGRVTDSYPVGPDIEINPYRSVNNEMLFQIGAGLGDYYSRPIAIYPQERARFAELLKTQKSQDGTVLFQSDDPVQSFQMFTLTEKPTKYTDFASGTRRTLSVRVPDRPGQMADAVSTIETLVPNKKYYYIFRSVDIHGHISNPTPIYEVELVDTDGAIYPLINVYEPQPELPIDLSKQGQRLLQIRPEYLQSVLDEEGSGLVGAITAGTPAGGSKGDLKLGIREEKLWNKKFKLRLTSCETRRMLDINLEFKTEHQTLDDCPPSTPDKSSQNRGLDVPDNTPLPGDEKNYTSASKTGTTATTADATMNRSAAAVGSTASAARGASTRSGGGSRGGSSY